MTKKRIPGILLGIMVMLLGMSITVWADTDYKLWVGGTQVTSANKDDVLANDPENKGKVSFILSDGGLSGTLTLNGAEIDNSLYIDGIGRSNIYSEFDNLKIVLKGQNRLGEGSTAAAYAIYAFGSGNVSIEGAGSLTAISDESTIQAANIEISGGQITATSQVREAIFAYNNISIIGGTVHAKGDFCGVYVGNGGVVTIGDKITSLTAVRTGDGLPHDEFVAIYGKVKNAIAGTGWTDTAGTQGKADIAASEEGQSLSAYKKVQFPVVSDDPAPQSQPQTVTPQPQTQPQTETPQTQTQPQTEASTPKVAEDRITITKTPAKVKAKVKKNKVTVSWKKIKKNKAGRKLLKKIKSIQVQYSTDKTFKKNVKTKSVGKKKTKVKLKLQKKTTYYIRMRYKGASGFSKWSKVKKVKTK